MIRAEHTLTRFDAKRKEAVVFNKKTGRMIVMHDDDALIWKNLPIDLKSVLFDDKSLIKRFKSHEMVQTDGKNGRLFRHNSDILIPPKWFVDLTYCCNLNCAHCHNKYSIEEPELWDIKKMIAEIAKLGGMYISFGGGEPFLRDDIFEIFDYVSRFKNLLWSAQSVKHGYRNREKKKKLKLKDLSCFIFSFSLP